MGSSSRRRFLLGAAAMGAGWGCAPERPAPTTGVAAGERMERGHLLRQGPPSWPGAAGERADVVVIGGGIAGLSAAWRLARADFAGRLVLLELGDALGGTSRAADSRHGPHPLGAHYTTLPNPGARHLHAIYQSLGVITGFDSEGRPHFGPHTLCLAPQERIWEGGGWWLGTWPGLGASPEDEAQRASLEAYFETWRRRRGADGRRAFEIPIAYSSQDPELRALSDQTFLEHLRAGGWTSPRLHWWLEYFTRDEFGTTLAETSAWAGLHYHCARVPEPSDARDLGTHVLTWPEGNGWLVRGLASRARAEVRTGAVVVRLEEAGESVRLAYRLGSELHELQARHVILAVPTAVAQRLLPRPSLPVVPEATPWRVVSLHCSRLPAARGVRTAWDSIQYGAEGLGYVTNVHQLGRYRGPAVLTWYEALAGEPPRAAARRLAEASPARSVDRALSILAPAHPDLLDCVEHVDVTSWGHGTARPAPGLHHEPVLQALRARRPRVSFAHTDLSGMSLFEEASWHGVRAAEEALEALGLTPEERLA